MLTHESGLQSVARVNKQLSQILAGRDLRDRSCDGLGDKGSDDDGEDSGELHDEAAGAFAEDC